MSSLRPPSGWPRAAAARRTPRTSPVWGQAPLRAAARRREHDDHATGGQRDPADGRVGHLHAGQRRSQPDRPDHRPDGVINITIPQGVTDTSISSEAHGGSGPCSQYELAAENDLRAANPVAPPPTQAQLVQYVDCMRANGVPDYPDPGPNNETKFPAERGPEQPDVRERQQGLRQAVNAPAWWIAGTGPPGDVVVSSAGIGPNGPTPGNRPVTVRPAPGGNSGSGSNG